MEIIFTLIKLDIRSSANDIQGSRIEERDLSKY